MTSPDPQVVTDSQMAELHNVFLDPQADLDTDLPDFAMGTEPGKRAVVLGPMQFNPLHDLESLWWIAVHFVVGKQIVSGDEVVEVSDKQRRYAELLVTSAEERWSSFMGERKFILEVLNLAPVVQSAAARLDDLRQAFVNAYRDIETTPASQKTVARWLAIRVADHFRSIAADLRRLPFPIHVQPFAKIERAKPKKPAAPTDCPAANTRSRSAK